MTKVIYQDDNVTLEAYCAQPDTHEKRPAVLIAHDWSGRGEFACQKARDIAELGYVGIAIDMYGDAKTGATVEEKQALMMPLMENRQLLRQRIMAAYKKIKSLEYVDSDRIAAMGFCFGGGCVLDLARHGARLKGVVSFHGLLSPPENIPNKEIHAKILALHGHDDPMVTPAQVAAFQKEMTDAKVDWQTHIYGNTQHAFTNPAANDLSLGTVYNAVANQRSWQTAKSFFTEIFH